MTSTSADPQDIIVYTGGKSTFLCQETYLIVKSVQSSTSALIYLLSQSLHTVNNTHDHKWQSWKTGLLNLFLKHPS